MGQTLYDAQAEHFRANNFYPDDAISPFLLLQRKTTLDELYRMELEFVSGRGPYIIDPETMAVRWLGIETEKYSYTALERASTIEQIEDHYISSVEPRDSGYEEFNVFTVNAQSSRQGAANQRGEGWVVLMHPETFRDFISSDRTEPRHFENIFSSPRRIGRWSLVANKVNRCQHFWTSDHLQVGEVITVYRTTDTNNKIDGLPIVPLDGEYGFPSSVPQGYILRERHAHYQTVANITETG